MAPKISSKVPPTKTIDSAEQYRTEIEERTASGETCEQIASALRAKGVSITNKTISRRRVEWGMRKRPYPKVSSTKVQKARPRKPGTRNAGIDARKAEIQMRTQQGETAEEIFAALQAQGHAFKRGASTITRLQTQYGLIPPDQDRARGRRRPKGSTEPRVRKPKEPKVSKRELEREANKQQQTQTLHYPTNCNFGPQKRANGDVEDQSEDEPFNPSLEMEHLPVTDDYYVPTAPPQGHTDVSAELMSVEILVDLANSTLGTANNLKDMLLAYQAQRPVSKSLSTRPPTLEDLATARRKVREAAGVMLDLAADPGTQAAAG